MSRDEAGRIRKRRFATTKALPVESHSKRAMNHQRVLWASASALIASLQRADISELHVGRLHVEELAVAEPRRRV